MKVDAWIATYPGGEKYLDETVASLKEQGIDPIILNDDRPTEEKWNHAIQWAPKQHKPYLALPHHDDIYLPGWADTLAEYLDSHPDAVAVLCLDYLIDEQGKRIGQTYPAWQEQDSYTFKDLFDLTLKHGNVLRCETVMLNLDVLGDQRYPDKSISGTAHDTQFWFELAAKHPIGIVMKPLVKYRVHPDSDTQQNVVKRDVSIDHLKAMLYASTLRPQDVEFTHVIGLTRALEAKLEAQEANRVRGRMEAGCEFLVCHEPPDAAGTGVVVAHRVRTLNQHEDGKIRYYVYPVEGTDIEVVWQNGLPCVKCPAGAFGDIIDRLKPSKAEFHHLLRWSLDILNAPIPHKELWLHDSYLWCARYHSVHRDGYVCNTPEPKKCADCSGEAVAALEGKRVYLAEVLPKMQRVVANSEYTAKYAKVNLNVNCEVIAPSGAPLAPRTRKKRVGYFGGFGVVKGTPVLLKAWRMLKGEAQLLMFCDVPAEWRTGRKIAGFDDVLVMGGYHRGDLPDLVNLVDLAVVPSINESYGMVKREIEGLGVTTIATDAGGLDGEIPAGDAEALASAIRASL